MITEEFVFLVLGNETIDHEFRPISTAISRSENHVAFKILLEATMQFITLNIIPTLSKNEKKLFK